MEQAIVNAFFDILLCLTLGWVAWLIILKIASSLLGLSGDIDTAVDIAEGRLSPPKIKEPKAPTRRFKRVMGMKSIF